MLGSCNNNDEFVSEQSENIEIELVGTNDYVSNIGCIIKQGGTRSAEYEQDCLVPLLVEESILFLNSNGIDYKEFFDDVSDPRIAVFAMALAEQEKYCQYGGLTRASVGGCVLEALGVKELVTSKAVTKAAVKAVGKAIVKKSVPYVGWGLFAVDMALCLSE